VYAGKRAVSAVVPAGEVFDEVDQHHEHDRHRPKDVDRRLSDQDRRLDHEQDDDRPLEAHLPAGDLDVESPLAGPLGNPLGELGPTHGELVPLGQAAAVTEPLAELAGERGGMQGRGVNGRGEQGQRPGHRHRDAVPRFPGRPPLSGAFIEPEVAIEISLHLRQECRGPLFGSPERGLMAGELEHRPLELGEPLGRPHDGGPARPPGDERAVERDRDGGRTAGRA